ncbi:cupin domain-containing protein [Mycolicibacterium sp. CH28]|nr:cupin domain-containing protein [Mycolicibacterium sp. CH28]
MEHVAAKSGVSRVYLSNIERDVNSPTVATLNKILEVLGLTLAELFGDQERVTHPVIRGGERNRVQLSQAPGVTWEFLTPAGAPLEMFMRYIEPGGMSGTEPHTHPGFEAGIVLRGRLTLWLGDEEHHLGKGDSISFASTTPHRYLNPGNTVCEAAWSSTEPQHRDISC